MESASDRLLSRREAARLLGIGLNTIEKMFHSGSLHRVKIGRATRIRLSQVRQVMNEGARVGSDEKVGNDG